jgi:hypothetical protein
MKKLIIILTVFLVFTLSGWVVLNAVNQTQNKSCTTACKKATAPCPAAGPSTGFFIIDSFSGIL